MPKAKKKESKKVNIHNGVLYPVLNSAVNAMKYLCLVEGYKFIGKKFAGSDNSLEIKYSRIAVDIFIITKWLFLAMLWTLGVKDKWTTVVIWYLLATNLYTYFYYHSWAIETLADTYFDPDRIKRRFNNLIMAFSYALFGFAYLYNLPYAQDFSWSNGKPTFIQSLWFSISTSLTAGYDQVKPSTNAGYSISMIQLLMMFVFLTIIIGGSIPQVNQINKDGLK